MPADYSLGGNHNQRLSPFGLEPTEGDPEKLVERTEAGPRMPTLQHDELLTEREILEKQAPTCPEQAAQRSEAQNNEAKHGQDLYQNGGETTATMLLISQWARVLANDRVLSFIYDRYIRPACLGGERQVSVFVLQVRRALSYRYEMDFIRAVLSSLTFRNTYDLALVSTDPEETEYVFSLKKDPLADADSSQQVTSKQRSS